MMSQTGGALQGSSKDSSTAEVHPHPRCSFSRSLTDGAERAETGAARPGSRRRDY